MKIISISDEFIWTKSERAKLESLGEFREVTTLPDSESELVSLLQDYDFAIITPLPFGFISKNILGKLPNLKGISITTTRFSWIDIGFAKEKNIIISNLPGYSTISVAELALGLMLDIARKISLSTSSAKKGNRSFEGYKGFELSGKTLGIIGLGAIGAYISNLGKGLGMKVVGFNRSSKNCNVELVDLEKLLKISDVVSLNLSLNDSTRNFLNKDNLKFIKSDSILINVSPEGLVDQDSIYQMLQSHKLSGYGFELDMNKKTEIQSKLLELPNVIATPHIGWYTPESEQRAKDITIKNVESMARGKAINNVF